MKTVSANADSPARDYWALYAEQRRAVANSPGQGRALAEAIRRERVRVVDAQASTWMADLGGSARAARLQSWFWFNHFNVYPNKGHVGALLPSFLYEALLRHQSGHFHEMLLAAIAHPAMQVYLDNVRNVKGKGNENLARELLELHTLGVDGGYTQADVKSVAQVLSGWGLDLGQPDSPYFALAKHEMGVRQVMTQMIRAQGRDQLADLLTWLARQPATARHLALKACWWGLSDAPSQQEVEIVQSRFLQTQGHLPSLWQAVDELAEVRLKNGTMVARLRTPIKYVSEALGVLVEAQQAAQEMTEMDSLNNKALRWLRHLGQPMFGRTTPDGFPLRAQDWLSGGQLAQRFSVAQQMAAALSDDAAANVSEKLKLALVARPGALALTSSAMAGLTQARTGRQRLALLLASPSFLSEAG